MDRYELAAILDDVGNFNMDDFSGRLVLQQTVRLLQAFGIDLGYRFAWYLHGPYCTALFRDGWRAHSVVDRLPRIDVRFEGEETQGRYEQFKQFMRDKKDDLGLLKACASMCHLAAAGIAKGDVLEAVGGRNPGFGRGQCESVWDELEGYGAVDGSGGGGAAQAAGRPT